MPSLASIVKASSSSTTTTAAMDNKNSPVHHNDSDSDNNNNKKIKKKVTIGQAGTRLNYKINEEVVGPPPQKVLQTSVPLS